MLHNEADTLEAHASQRLKDRQVSGSFPIYLTKKLDANDDTRNLGAVTRGQIGVSVVMNDAAFATNLRTHQTGGTTPGTCIMIFCGFQ